MLEYWWLLVFGLAWVGHACICTALLNYLYGRRLPKSLLKPWRFVTGVLILAFPLPLLPIEIASTGAQGFPPAHSEQSGFVTALGCLFLAYPVACLYVGAVFVVITFERYFRKPPACVVAETT